MHRSRPQREFEKMLDALRISYFSEHEEMVPWCLDVYVPEWHFAVEIDGPHHTPKGDLRRDTNLLEQYACPTLRLPAELMATRDGKTEAIERFIKFAEEHAGDVHERKAKWRSAR